MFAHTYYSLKYGTLSPAKLVEAAAAKGLKVLALADINNTSCGFDFIQQCKKHNIKPVLGIDFRQNNKQLYVGIARNEEGFKELCSFLTQHSLQNSKLPVVPPHMQNVYIIYTDPPKPIEQFKSYEFIGIRPENANKIYSSNWRNNIDKLIAYSPICFLDKLGYKTHKILRAIDLNTVFSKLDATEMAQSHDQLYSTTDLESFYENYPQLIENSNSLFDNCSIEIQADNNNNRQSFTGTKEDDMKLLVKFALNGATKRYKGSLYVNAMERINKELKIIKELGFAPYFLIIWDIIRYAQSAGYHHIGRGSGANSIVAYCLYITDVDPIELDLYFERFINPYRVSPPDFDIDFSWSERDDVIDYIFNRYGREHTALLATYNTFKTKSTLREIAKVVGLPKEDIDLIIREPFATDRHHPMGKTITKYAKLIEGFPNYLSIHAGGILISERPLNYHTALQLMPKGFPITHFDMYGAEDLQFHKYDILSQRG
ncbi:MAG TPA: PHP domain-containing protein, partial [Saprospiraceae bacterium]|nr:PHP domain-containing protein [Saprospiraceae bacterium]